jgi:outer membrane receptor for ferrienterochelin and colicins
MKIMRSVQKSFQNNVVTGSRLWGPSLILLTIFVGTSAQAASESAQKPDTIVVTATRTELDIVDAPASVSVVTALDLELSASVDVLDAVRQTPGISFQGRGFGGRQSLSIRGMGRDQTLFLIDGRRVLSTDNVFNHSNFQYNWVPMNSIEQIEIVRGPLSALYGSEALGGVVNIVTKPIAETWSGSASARYTLAEREGDEQYLALSAAGPLGDKMGALLSYTFNDVEEIPFAANSALSELEGKQSHNLYGRMNLDVAPDHKLNFDFAWVTEDRYRNTQDRVRPPVFESSFDLDKIQFGGGYTGSFGQVTAQLNVNHAELERINFRTNGIAPSVPQVFKNDVIDGHLVIPGGQNHRFVVGGEVRRETLEHAAIAGGQGSLDYVGVFAQDEWVLSDKLRITGGLRYDSHENFGSEISPRAYLVYHFNDNWSLKGGYGHGFRSPTIKQSLDDYRFVGPFTFVGNANVGPETSDNFELNLSYRSGNTRLAVTGFVNQVDDLITTMCIQNCSARFGRVFTYVNLEQTETKGIETEIEFDLGESWELSASHVYMEAENRATGLRLAERPDHVFSAQLAWNWQQPDLRAVLRASWHGAEVEYDRLGTVIELPGYMMWNLQTSWAINDLWQINAGIKNLSDVKLAEKSASFDYAERGRSAYFGVRRDF